MKSPTPVRTLTGPKGFLKRLTVLEESQFDRAAVELGAASLLNNYRVIRGLVPKLEILPMLKANAYGHGADWAARILLNESGLSGFGVATLQEGADLRSGMGTRGRKIPILVFAETSPWSDAKGQFCERNGLTAVISSEGDWAAFLKAGWISRIPYEFQFNTGMNRLGISPGFTSQLIKDLRKRESTEHPKGIFSHLAMSETPDAKLTVLQVDRFTAIRRELGSIFPTVRFHLANSGGIWNSKNYGLDSLTDMVRPGLSLYGIPPWPGAPVRGLIPVLSFRAKVVAIHRLKPGDSIGYGGTYRVKGKDAVFAAIIGAGYGDGVHRALSNEGHAELDGKMTRFMGMVSMDLSAIACWEGTQVGTWTELLGAQVDAWIQAKAASTIPYELLTSISPRVKRIYV